MFLVGLPPFARNANTRIIDEITNLGLTNGLVLCLDAGDDASYDGSSQTWNDVSGNSNHFFRGSGSGSNGTDPSFNGTANSRSQAEYFSSDGGDAFWQASSHTFANEWHKNGTAFTVSGWTLIPTGAAKSAQFISNVFDVSDIGISVGVSALASTGRVNLTMANGAVSVNFAPATTDSIVENAWMFAALSFSEGSGASFARANGTVELLANDTYSSPSASDAPNGLAIWGAPNAAGTALYTADTLNMPSSGTLLNSVLAWGRALSQAEIAALYNATKGKFGL